MDRVLRVACDGDGLDRCDVACREKQGLLVVGVDPDGVCGQVSGRSVGQVHPEFAACGNDIGCGDKDRFIEDDVSDGSDIRIEDALVVGDCLCRNGLMEDSEC